MTNENIGMEPLKWLHQYRIFRVLYIVYLLATGFTNLLTKLFHHLIILHNKFHIFFSFNRIYLNFKKH